ncbi:PIN domain-containing protein [Streptomyces sp. NPDC017082]|uniref:PIN domain-containing protein n=1 Tax=Streptomyces sp. NPDC017082 TaxID=3364974 RepID=UPI00379441B1
MSEYHVGSFTAGYEEFWRKSQSSVDQAIESHQVVLDTNAVLHLYRMNSSARAEYLTVLERIAERIWIPRQVADEFHRNRISSVDVHIRALKEKSSAVMEAADVLQSRLRDFARLHSLAGSASSYLAPLNDYISQIKQAVQGDVDDFDLSPDRLVSDDPILRRLAVIFDTRVGAGVPPDDRQEVQREAERRGKEKIPPGYKDVAKKGEEGYGDYFIWREMLEHAQATKSPILFVSTDVKEDWVRMQCGLAVGPRPELVAEMRRVAGVQYSHVTLAAFLARVTKVLNVPVSQATIDQVKDRSDSQRKLKSELVNLTSELAEIEDKTHWLRRLIDEVEQREMLAAARLAVAEGAAARLESSSPEWVNISTEIDHFKANLHEAATMRHGYLEELRNLEHSRMVATDKLKVLEVLL